MEVEPWPPVISLRSPQTVGSDPFLSHYPLLQPEVMADLHHSTPSHPDLTQGSSQSSSTPDSDNRPGKTGKMHSGTRLTCEPCRERKVKCNRMFPECNRCSRLGYKCTYRDRVSHRASQAAVIQQLQERMSQAEARLAQQGITMTPGTSSSPASQHQTIAAAGFPPPPPSSSSASSVAGSIPRSTVVHHQQSESPVDLSFNAVASIPLGLGRAGSGFDRVPVSIVQDTPTLADFNFSALANTGFGHHDPAGAGTEQAYGVVAHSLDMDLGSPALDWNQMRAPTATGEPSSSTFHFRSLSLGSSEETANIITSEDLSTLHQIFFDRFSTAMPILYKDKFYQELRNSPDDLALKSVSFTISLLAILISEQHRHLEKTCYTLARRYIDACETEDESNTFGSIRFFQSLLFLTRYELARRNCTRASMLLGRAVRLGKLLRLDQLDKPGDGTPWSSTGIIGIPYAPLRPTQDVVEVEERRRCLWALYVIEGYSTIHTGSLGSLDDEEIFVSLPSPGILDSRFTPAQMPTLPLAISAIRNPEETIPPSTGIILVVSLLRKVVQHTLAAESFQQSTVTTQHGNKNIHNNNHNRKRLLSSAGYHPSPGFWDRHYALIKECSEYGNLLRHFCSARVLYNDPLAFNIYLTFCAIELRLWDAALHEAEQSGLPNAGESMRHVEVCAVKIGKTVRSTWGMQRMACDNMSLSGAFVAWPLCMAIKGLNRQLSLETRDDQQQQQQVQVQEQIKRKSNSGTASTTTSSSSKGPGGQQPSLPAPPPQPIIGPSEDMERIKLLQILCAALDEVESPTGPWHESVAGFVNNLGGGPVQG